MAIQGINKKQKSKLNGKGTGLLFRIYKYWLWELILSVEMSHLIRILFKPVLESLVYVTNY